MHRNLIFYTLLVGIYSGTATVKNCVASSKIKNHVFTIQPSKCIPGYLSQRNRNFAV